MIHQDYYHPNSVGFKYLFRAGIHLTSIQYLREAQGKTAAMTGLQGQAATVIHMDSSANRVQTAQTGGSRDSTSSHYSAQRVFSGASSVPKHHC